MPKPSPTEPLPPLSGQNSLLDFGGGNGRGSEGGSGFRPGSRVSEPGEKHKLQDMETIVMVKQYALDAVKKAVARFMDPKVQVSMSTCFHTLTSSPCPF